MLFAESVVVYSNCQVADCIHILQLRLLTLFKFLLAVYVYIHVQ